MYDSAAHAAAWNRMNEVGTSVRIRRYPEQDHVTRPPAVMLFGGRPDIYVDGLKGDLRLEDVHPLPHPALADVDKGLTVVFPGQGAQFKGMGRALFDAYPRLTQQASELVGYPIDRLCLDDPHAQLAQTQYTQPALYVVSALGWQSLCDQGHPANSCLSRLYENSVVS